MLFNESWLEDLNHALLHPNRSLAIALNLISVSSVVCIRLYTAALHQRTFPLSLSLSVFVLEVVH